MKTAIAIIIAALFAGITMSVGQEIHVVKVLDNYLTTSNVTVVSQGVDLSGYKPLQTTYGLQYQVTGTNIPSLTNVVVDISIDGSHWYSNIVIAGSANFKTNSGLNGDGYEYVAITPSASKYLRLRTMTTGSWGYVSAWLLLK